MMMTTTGGVGSIIDSIITIILIGAIVDDGDTLFRGDAIGTLRHFSVGDRFSWTKDGMVLLDTSTPRWWALGITRHGTCGRPGIDNHSLMLWDRCPAPEINVVRPVAAIQRYHLEVGGGGGNRSRIDVQQGLLWLQ